MRHWIHACLLAAVLPAKGAYADGKTFSFDFNEANLAWALGFSDYPQMRDGDWGFKVGYSALPTEIADSRNALFLAGNNHSDDLFMFAAGAMFDLEPGREYSVAATFTIATNAPYGCVGIGGSPGNSVYVKFGATSAQPRSLLDNSGDYRMTIDKGNQASPGVNAIVAGNIAGTNTDCHNTTFELKTFDTGETEVVTAANGEGAIWLIIGSDSGFEGRSAWYLVDLVATVTPRQ